MSRAPRARLERFGWAALGVGVLGAVAAVGVGALAPRAAHFGWHLACVFWTGAAVGCGALLAVHHMTGGRWGWAVRGPLEAGALTVPLLGVLFLVPLALGGIEALFPFGRIPPGEGPPLLEHKRPYLNAPFFLTRNAGFFLVWTASGLLLSRHGAGAPAQPFYSRLAAPAFVLYVLTVTFAAYDWIVALQPAWYSTIVGLYLLTGQGLTAIAAVALLGSLLPAPLGTRPEQAGERLDVGNLMLAAVVLYTYCAFAQWLITWSGDLPHEVAFYTPRIQGGWFYVVWALIAVHFFLPLFVLLSRAAKRTPSSLAGIALVVLGARVLADGWMILPVSGAPPGPLSAASLAGLLAVGGLWTGATALVWARRLGGAAPDEEPPGEGAEPAPPTGGEPSEVRA